MTQKTPTHGFRGALFGVEYTDPKAFEKAARRAGFRRNAPRRLTIGAEVVIQLRDRTRIRGQVWARGERSTVWVALETGQYARVSTRDRGASICDGVGHPIGTYGELAA